MSVLEEAVHGAAAPARPRSAPRVPAAVRRFLTGGGALVVGSTLVWHLSNFLFNSVAARVLGPADYGTLAAIVALLYLSSPLFVSVQTVASRTATSLHVAGDDAGVSAMIRSYAVRLAPAGVVLAAGVALGAPAIAGFLNVEQSAPIALLGIALACFLITHLQRGALQGTMRFGRYALSTTVEATSKIAVAAVLLTTVWRSVDGAAAAIAISGVVAIAGNAALLRFLPRARRDVSLPAPYRYSAMTFSCLALLALLLSLDILAAKHYLSPHAAGVYASVSLCGKVVFFASSALSVYLFPIFSAHQDAGTSPRRPLAMALAVVAGLSALVAAVYAVAPGIVVVPLFGSEFMVGAKYLAFAGTAFGLYALVYLLATYLLSQGRMAGSAVLAAGVAATAAGLVLFHSSTWAIIAVQAVAFGATALVLAALAFRTGEAT